MAGFSNFFRVNKEFKKLLFSLSVRFVFFNSALQTVNKIKMNSTFILMVIFKLHNDCTFAGIENDTDMCDVLKITFLANTMLNISLIIGFLLTSTTVWSLIWMMFGHFFRFTNVFLLLSGVLFLA